MDEPVVTPPVKRSWFRFSLRTLLILILMVSAYLAGRFGNSHFFPSQLVGTWEAVLPRGHQRSVTLTHLENDRFLLDSKGSVFDGVYLWDNDQLVMDAPDDQRMMGLVWKWQDGKMTLIGEPRSQPTGTSYLGTKLKRIVPPDS